MLRSAPPERSIRVPLPGGKSKACLGEINARTISLAGGAMDYEAIAKTWDRLAQNHDQTAQILSNKTGSPELDLQNAFSVQTERIQAEHCRLMAQEIRDRCRA